ETGVSYPRGVPVETSKIGWIRMGTTVATNALLERKGEKMALVITDGFEDLLYIGNQSRPKIFDLKIQMPEMLYSEVVSINERVILKGDSQIDEERSLREVTAANGEQLLILKELDISEVRSKLNKVYSNGIRSLAIVFMHSYIYDDHEKKIAAVAREIGFTHVSMSSEIMPMVRIVPRGDTASADAYLTPAISSYLRGFSRGFKDNLQGIQVMFMQSDGGLTPMDTFTGSRAIVSGPAGGVVGYAKTTQSEGQPVIGFDMGGTSTDVSRYAGSFEHVFESTISGLSIQAPQLDINTVAAGGGSVLQFRAGLFVVGPESAGAHPGPVCYRKGGYLAVTDANLALGRILPEYFPKIFGESEDQPLDLEASRLKFKEVQNQVKESGKIMSLEELAMGFLEVANEAMCRPIREITQAKGYDTSKHVLACFGGAGGQHACAIAKTLGMKNIFIHRYAGILSAYGMALADVVHEEQEPCSKPYEDSFDHIDQRLETLKKKCRQVLQNQGFSPNQMTMEVYLNLRYEGTDCALMCEPYPGSGTRHGDFYRSFVERYQREFGFTLKNRAIIVDDIRVRGIGGLGLDIKRKQSKEDSPPNVECVKKVYFINSWMDTPIFLMEKLAHGHKVPGPAVIIDKLSTIVVEPGCIANITESGDISIQVEIESHRQIGLDLDLIQLSIFSHRFMSIAEQMGRVLQRTSVSTNIKERLDFSCALFGPDGGLVSNAPHIPVHLGAMQETVQYQMRVRDGDINPGDVFLANHPLAGGSHLPDLTVITPVFWKDQAYPVFFVASRGHHADIGGATPGSMPPHSKSIDEEGAVFQSFLLVRKGVFQEQELIEKLMAPGKIPGCSGTRCLSDNISDLRAQIAANQKGINLVCELIDYYGLQVVQTYMKYIQENAELAVREMLKEVAMKSLQETGKSILVAEDFMDDGTCIKLAITIDSDEGEAVFDFEGTGYQVYGNCNTPRAITLSAIIYCLRCLVGHDVPLNQGCLKPIKVKIPAGSILSPSPDAAVVGGNVQTSQRIVDTILKAFGACAASCGDMNNVTFGDESLGYYETVAGGAGA
ncbi:hypothetical protein QYM36_001279, partial [Artemia franciscana]